MQLPAGPAALAAPLLALPVAFGLSAVSALDGNVGFGVLGALQKQECGIWSFGDPARSPPLPAVLVVFSFISAVDLLIALEEDGLISGFMELYVREGDPHLRTAHGLLTCYWDGTVHYGLCLAMAAAAGRSRGSWGEYWGSQRGFGGPEEGFGGPEEDLGVPVRFWGSRGGFWVSWRGSWGGFGVPGRVPCPRPPCAPQVVLDCPADACFDYTYLHEPYLRDPVGYPKVQMLIYLFYLLPFLILAIYGLAVPGCSWLPDWSLVFAGAVAQAQFAHLGSSLHSRTPFPYQTPEEVLWSFLLSNVLYALGPQLLALRCLRAPAFFVPPAGPGLARAKKCQ
uniref:Transmembrane 6 superfamily member 2 n=1 Tax=Junco hyemalis TaxID=40217 RepID=A0A8C5IMU4_JUNHY